MISLERDNKWLEKTLLFVWDKYFPDLSKKDNVKIKFGRSARTRLGSISKKTKDSDTLIRITSFFKDERVPQYVIEATVAHELCHYAHGFFSPMPKLFKYPHKGGLVDREMISRGMEEILKKQKVWLKDNWKNIVGPIKRRRYNRRRRIAHSNNALFWLLKRI